MLTQNVQYGNQSEVDYAYSFCALLFVIPPYSERVEVQLDNDSTRVNLD